MLLKLRRTAPMFFAFMAAIILQAAAHRAAQADFQMGTIDPREPIASIKVTISLGAAGDDLAEPVDLHLGLGFPLRLHPLGTDSHEPAFAAFPRTTTLAAGTNSLAPGESASFEFFAQAVPGDSGNDVLLATPEMLRGLMVGAVRKIGFASRGTSNWVLDGYTIEINGKLYASQDGLDLHNQTVQQANQAALQQMLADFETKASATADLEAFVATGLADDAAKTLLTTSQAELAAAADAVNSLASRVAGALPWFTEADAAFQPAPIAGDLATRLEVTIHPYDGPHAGSQNPLYLWAQGRKFLLTSEDDPLDVGPDPVTFEISPAELEINPLVKSDLGKIGIGMVGSDRPYGAIPDRARLARVVVVADGETTYDSDLAAADQAVLTWQRLIPPAHRDTDGNAIVNVPIPRETTLWMSGAVASPANDVPEPPAEVPPPVDATFTDASYGPVIVLVPYDPDGLNPPRRRKRKNPNGSTVPAINIIVNPGRNLPPRPITPKPAPLAPVLSNIRVNPAVPILRNGDTATVTWQVSGNVSNVRSYRVDLFGVLPHLNPPLLNTPLSTLTGIKPLRTSSVAGGTQTMTANPPAITVANIRRQLPPPSGQYLYVQPKVTALSANGTAIVSGFGSILPLFPAATPNPHPGLLAQGQIWSQGALVVGNVPPPSFQILPAAGAPSAWTTCSPADPKTFSTAWPLNTEQDSVSALTFASYIPGLGVIGLPALNAAVRPAANGERVAVQFEGQVLLPSNLPNPAKGWRLVGHVGFIGNGASPNTANVQTRINLSARPSSPIPFYTMQTPTPIVYNKFSSGGAPAPCLLIDMPVRFDLMPANNAGATHDTSKYAITTFVANGPNSFSTLGTPAAGGRPLVYYTITLMISQQAPGPNNAIGIFGLRLVPTNN